MRIPAGIKLLFICISSINGQALKFKGPVYPLIHAAKYLLMGIPVWKFCGRFVKTHLQ